MKLLSAFFVLIFIASLSACAKQPTISETTVDLRPALSFTLASKKQDASSFEVFVDGLNMGSAEQYIQGKAALRVLSGTHLIQVKQHGQVVLEQKIYLGDSAVKSLSLPR